MMLSFSHDLGVAQVRTVGVFQRDGKVLIHQLQGDSFWTLPGGRVEFGEEATTALMREMREELNADVCIERLVWVVENFFELQDKPYHEFAFYFLAHLPEQYEALRQDEFIGKEGEQTLVFRWVSVAELSTIELYPLFLKEGLQALPTTVVHVVQKG